MATGRKDTSETLLEPSPNRPLHEVRLVLAAVLIAAEPLLLVPAELAFGEGDLRSARRAEQLALFYHRSSIHHLRWSRDSFHGDLCCRGLVRARLHEIRQIQLRRRPMLPNQFLAPFLQRVQRAHVCSCVKELGDAKFLLHELLVPRRKLVRFDDVRGVEVRLLRSRDDRLRMEHHNVITLERSTRTTLVSSRSRRSCRMRECR